MLISQKSSSFCLRKDREMNKQPKLERSVGALLLIRFFFYISIHCAANVFFLSLLFTFAALNVIFFFAKCWWTRDKKQIDKFEFLMCNLTRRINYMDWVGFSECLSCWVYVCGPILRSNFIVVFVLLWIWSSMPQLNLQKARESLTHFYESLFKEEKTKSE